MQSDDPAFLVVGTEVSAKFKGAFCEAKIKKISKLIKCKVLLKESPFGSVMVEDTAIKSGSLEINQNVEVQQGKHLLKAVIQSVKDCSTYHVVFNDGDEKILRRTGMCLKGAKHFDSAVNLDALPLYNPEQFSSPVVRGGSKLDKKGKKRKGSDMSSPSKRLKSKRDQAEEDSDDEKSQKREKRAAASAANVAIGEMDQGETEASCDGTSSSEGSDVEKERKKKEKEEDKKGTEKKGTTSKDKEKTSHEDKLEAKDYKVGDVVCVFEEENCKGKWFPAVVVASKAYKKSPKPRVLGKKELPVRSFQNGKYMGISWTQLSSFEQQSLGKKALDAMSSALRSAVDRAQNYLGKGTLPGNWEKREIDGEDAPSTSKQKKNEKEEKEASSKKTKEKDEKKETKDDKDKKKEKSKVAETDSSSSESSGEEEYGEERDLFVAQLYKFQEERGTPINRAPVLGGKDIDLYRFYRVVQRYGGAKKATSNLKWKRILVRMKLEGCAGATPVTVRKAYIRYLAHFNSFYKRLGWSLDELSSTSTVNSPRERRLIRSQTEDKNKEKIISKRRKSTTSEGKGKKEDDTDKESVADAKERESEKQRQEKKETAEKERAKTERKETERQKAEKRELEKKTEKKEAERKETERERVRVEREKKETEKKAEKKEVEKEKSKTDRKEREERRSERTPAPAISVPDKEKEKQKADSEKKKEDRKEEKKKEEKKDDKKKEKNEKPNKKEEPVRQSEKAKSETSPEKPLISAKMPDAGKEATAKDGKPAESKEKTAEKEGEPVTSRREKKEGESDEDGDGRRRKERRRMSMKERFPPKTSDSQESFKDPDEGYHQADVFSHFYLGQKVRAQHHGRWYDARVVTVHQPPTKEIADLLAQKDGELSEPTVGVMIRLHAVMADMRCFVHYLGWNSRYDEWITLNKIRISIKDEQTSLSLLRRECGSRVSEERLQWIIQWSLSPKGVHSLHKKEEVTANMFSMGGYRPRRMSISQYEQLSAAAEQLRNQASTSKLRSPTPSTSRSPAVSTNSTEKVCPAANVPSTSTQAVAKDTVKDDKKEAEVKEVEKVKEKEVKVPSPVPSPSTRGPRSSEATSSPIRESRRLRTNSRDLPPSPSPSIASTHTQPQQQRRSPSKRSQTPASIPTPTTPTPDVEMRVSTSIDTRSDIDDSIFSVSSAMSVKEELTSSGTLAEIVMEEETQRRQTVVPPPPPELFVLMRAKEVSDLVGELPIPVREVKQEEETVISSESTVSTVEQLRSRRTRNDSELERREEREEREFDRLEEEAKSLVSQAQQQKEEDTLSEGGGSIGSETPQRTDNEDDKCSTDQSPSSGMISPGPGRGRGMKRKRPAHSRHSQMVVDRKYMKHNKPKERVSDQHKTTGSDGEEEEESEDHVNTARSFVRQKNEMYRVMERENALDDISPLGMDCITSMLHLPEDELIELCEQRMNDLRNIYLTAKMEINNHEKRWRSKSERKNEKEKGSRESLTTTPIPLPSAEKT